MIECLTQCIFRSDVKGPVLALFYNNKTSLDKMITHHNSKIIEITFLAQELMLLIHAIPECLSRVQKVVLQWGIQEMIDT